MVLGQPQQLQNQAGPTIPARRGSPRFRARARRRVPPRTQRSAPSTGAECVAVDAIALSRIVGDAPLASFHLHDVKQRSFFVPMTRSCARVLYFRFVGWVERKRNPSPSHRAPSRWVSLRSTHPTSSSQYPRTRGGRSAGPPPVPLHVASDCPRLLQSLNFLPLRRPHAASTVLTIHLLKPG
jgi:hypothetical protein